MQLISRLKQYKDSDVYPFHMPGHKRRLAPDELLEKIYSVDITEIEGFDDLHDATGILKEAMDAAARLFGSDEAYFLVNGSTCGIEAAITGTVTDGDAAVVAANCHRSVFNAVMLSGARMVMITPQTEPSFDTYGGIDAGTVKDAIDAAKSISTGRQTAVVITSPTYEGITSDVKAIADICHENDAVLIVDAAHGAHLGFSDDLPKSAILSGADVVVTSVHKTLPAMTQTALLLMRKDCPKKERIKKMLSVFMTSSPSYVLMASIDSMTKELSDHGAKLFDDLIKRLDAFYDKTKKLGCLEILSKEQLTAKGSADFDRTKIVVKDATGTLSGKELSDHLAGFGICAEMATDVYVLLMTTVADTDEGFRRLSDALFAIDDDLRKRTGGALREDHAEGEAAKVQVCDFCMKKTFFSDDKEYVPLDKAAQRTAGEMVTIYPPGIPVTLPGALISKEAVAKLEKALDNGIDIIGLKDKEISVTWERSSI